MEPSVGMVMVSSPDLAFDENPRSFTFDKVMGPEVSQNQVYLSTAKSIIESTIEGYNGTIFAYGQTGAGKTYTMEGKFEAPELQGITPRAFDNIFDLIEQQSSSTRFLVACSYVEIYNEEIRDLLSPDTGKKLEMKDVRNGSILVGVYRPLVKSREELLHFMRIGSSNRVTASTLMNADSSRSHSIMTIHIERADPAMEGERIRAAKLNLVDLAGSERQSKTGAVGERLKEATKINFSLTTLGNVISALVEGKSSHIPYRDSKLTRLLQDSLGGNTKTVIIAAVSPSASNYDETLTTLRFADRAKRLVNCPVINEDPKDALIRQLVDEIQLLKSILIKTAESGTAVSPEDIQKVRSVTSSLHNGGFNDSSMSPLGSPLLGGVSVSSSAQLSAHNGVVRRHIPPAEMTLANPNSSIPIRGTGPSPSRRITSVSNGNSHVTNGIGNSNFSNNIPNRSNTNNNNTNNQRRPISAVSVSQSAVSAPPVSNISSRYSPRQKFQTQQPQPQQPQTSSPTTKLLGPSMGLVSPTGAKTRVTSNNNNVAVNSPANLTAGSESPTTVTSTSNSKASKSPAKRPPAVVPQTPGLPRTSTEDASSSPSPANRRIPQSLRTAAPRAANGVSPNDSPPLKAFIPPTSIAMASPRRNNNNSSVTAAGDTGIDVASLPQSPGQKSLHGPLAPLPSTSESVPLGANNAANSQETGAETDSTNMRTSSSALSRSGRFKTLQPIKEAPSLGANPTSAAANNRQETKGASKRSPSVLGDNSFEAASTTNASPLLHSQKKEAYLSPDNTVHAIPLSTEGSIDEESGLRFGKHSWPDGSFYEGYFMGSNVHGLGKYVWGDGRVYEGQWSGGAMEGEGQFTWPDGRIYEGSFKAKMREGLGMFRWADGREYVGQWVNGKQEGLGAMRRKGRIPKWALWQGGERKNWIVGDDLHGEDESSINAIKERMELMDKNDNNAHHD